MCPRPAITIDTMLEKSFEKMGKGYAQALNIQLKKTK
jgi:hypothetical protein